MAARRSEADPGSLCDRAADGWVGEKRKKDPDAAGTMEFPFDVDSLLGERITTVDQHLQPSGRRGPGFASTHR